MSEPPTDALEDLRRRVRAFVAERDWEQFHSPKNLATALMVEAAEVAEHFQWLSETASNALPEATRREVALELADVLIYLLRLADRLDVDLRQSAVEKLAINARKYPADKARGNARKYDRLE